MPSLYTVIQLSSLQVWWSPISPRRSPFSVDVRRQLRAVRTSLHIMTSLTTSSTTCKQRTWCLNGCRATAKSAQSFGPRSASAGRLYAYLISVSNRVTWTSGWFVAVMARSPLLLLPHYSVENLSVLYSFLVIASFLSTKFTLVRWNGNVRRVEKSVRHMLYVTQRFVGDSFHKRLFPSLQMSFIHSPGVATCSLIAIGFFPQMLVSAFRKVASSIVTCEKSSWPHRLLTTIVRRCLVSVVFSLESQDLSHITFAWPITVLRATLQLPGRESCNNTTLMGADLYPSDIETVDLLLG